MQKYAGGGIMMLHSIDALLKQAMGLDSSSIGLSALERAVHTRCRIQGVADPARYLELVLSSKDELQQLVETVAVPETWFFRDPRAFEAMAHYAMHDWLPRNASGQLRLLSIPCSTGEEPYSMAMALLEAGFPADRLRIDATDISARVIEIAQAGVYGRNSFRGRNLGFRDRYFTANGKGHELTPEIRTIVRFSRGNLLDPAFPPASGEYDIIFCRNLLIYFDAADQARAVKIIERMLAATGMLFIGHSESGLLIGRGFASARIPLAFAFRKQIETRRQTPGPAAAAPAIPAAAPIRLRPVKPVPVSPARQSPQPAQQSTSKAVPDLEAIQQMANDGALADAAAACAEYLRHYGPSVEALYMQAAINDAAGNLEKADICYRKVLYLDPLHHEALTHLALLLERQGDRAGADRLNERSRRQLAGGR